MLDHYVMNTPDWRELREELVGPVGEGVTDEELWDIGERHLWTGTDESATNYRILTSFIEAARAVLARWGHQPAPPAAVAPGPTMEDVGPLIAWLTEQAHQAADASQPTDAGMLTWAAQVIGERVDEDAPAPPAAGEVGELVAELRMMASQAAEACQFTDAESLSRAADLLSIAYATGEEAWEPVAQLPAQRHPAPVPVAERLQQLEDLAADAVSGLRYIEQTHGRLYGVGWDRVYEKADRLQPAHALPLPAGEVQP